MQTLSLYYYFTRIKCSESLERFEIGQAIMWRQGLPIILDMYVEILIN